MLDDYTPKIEMPNSTSLPVKGVGDVGVSLGVDGEIVSFFGIFF